MNKQTKNNIKIKNTTQEVAEYILSGIIKYYEK